ncbi:unnamed protein product, partial [Rhizophagus irregularis]
MWIIDNLRCLVFNKNGSLRLIDSLSRFRKELLKCFKNFSLGSLPVNSSAWTLSRMVLTVLLPSFFAFRPGFSSAFRPGLSSAFWPGLSLGKYVVLCISTWTLSR